jgi:hypothetical protein
MHYGYIIYTYLSAELFCCDVKILNDVVTKYYLEIDGYGNIPQ